VGEGRPKAIRPSIHKSEQFGENNFSKLFFFTDFARRRLCRGLKKNFFYSPLFFFHANVLGFIDELSQNENEHSS